MIYYDFEGKGASSLSNASTRSSHRLALHAIDCSAGVQYGTERV